MSFFAFCEAGEVLYRFCECYISCTTLVQALLIYVPILSTKVIVIRSIKVIFIRDKQQQKNAMNRTDKEFIV